MSDRFGRKPVIIFGLLLAAVASVASAFTHTIDSFLLMRLIQGVGAGACMGIGRTVATDVLQGEKLSSIGSYFGMFLALSPLFAPALGGYVQHWFGWQANFILLAIIFIIVMLIYLFLCPETNQHLNPNTAKPSVLLKNYFTIIKNFDFDLYTLLSAVAVSIVMAYATTGAAFI